MPKARSRSPFKCCPASSAAPTATQTRFARRPFDRSWNSVTICSRACFWLRALPASMYTPSSTRIMGLILSREPSRLLALPMRPPLARYSRVFSVNTTSWLAREASMARITSSTLWPAAMASDAAVTCTEVPTLMERESTTLMSRPRWSAACLAAWYVPLSPDEMCSEIIVSYPWANSFSYSSINSPGDGWLVVGSVLASASIG